MYLKRLPAVALAAGLSLPGAVWATNGMIFEGYGPIASAMGGAAMAYDNGTAAMANNPATLALGPDGARFDVALGFIGPDVKSSAQGQSKAEAFYMPAVGYVIKSGKLAYGVGVFAQGGMGTDYPTGDFAQVGVGRAIFPIAYAVSDAFTIGGSVDYVWADMDLVYTAYNINFKDHSDFSGKTKGHGIAGKIGFTYKLNQQFTVGGVYETAGNLDTLSGGGYKVKDFDMPPILALGVAWQVNDKLMAVADVKDVMWNDSMNTVTILYPGAVTCNPGVTCAPFVQNWDDQIVLSLGAAYKFSEALTGRIGYNHADNPIPSQNMNFVWPAIVENHYTVGFGYAFDEGSEVNFSLSYVPEVSQTNPGNFTVDHSQINWQLMYSKKF